MELTEEIINEIFNKCYLPYEEMLLACDTYTEENAPDVAPLLLPLPNGVNAVAFRSEELKENRGLISRLLDEIDWIKYDYNMPFLGLMTRIDGTQWTKGIYEMQKLYALGIASDLINTKRTSTGYIIKRINPREANVNLVSMDSSGKVKKVKL